MSPVQTAGQIHVNVQYQYGSPVLRRDAEEFTFTPTDPDLFNKWQPDMGANLPRSGVVKFLLNELIKMDNFPQGLMFERITLRDDNGHKVDDKLSTLGGGALIFDRHTAQGTDGKLYYDYCQRGDYTNRLIGDGPIIR